MSYQPKHSARSKWRTPVVAFRSIGISLIVALLGSTVLAPIGLANVAAALSGTAPCVATYNADGSTDIHCDAIAAPSPTPTMASPSPSPTIMPTVTPSPSPTVTRTATPSPSPSGAWPSQASAGVPAGWVPTTARGTWTISAPGTYTDVRVTGDINVRVAGVTLRRVEVIDGDINNDGAGCRGVGLTLDQVTVRTGNGQPGGSSEGAIGPGGYTATRVAILDTIEGFRVGHKSVCGPVSISDSYARVKDGGNCNLHADGLQGYDGGPVTVRHTTLYFAATCGTAAFFVPSGQGNTSATIDGLFVWGPGVGYTFRLGVPATVHGLLIGQPWVYGPIDVKCSLIAPTAWQASIVSVGADGQPSGVVRDQPCNTEAGN